MCYSGLPIIIFITFILLFSLNQTVEAENIGHIIINEVMYDPVENDYYNEWIELYNPTNQSINISNWSITDNSAEDYLQGDFDNGNGTTIIPPHSYAIVADHGTEIYENFFIPNNTIRLYVDDASIGNGLSNDEDKLILKNSTGNVIDAIEWGYDYIDVPGSPADLVDEGHSLARYQDMDTDNSSTDFYYGITPTPGRENELDLDIDLYPAYISKIQNDSEYSIPVAIKTSVSNFSPHQNYQVKAYVIGNISSNYPATQTWNGTTWSWSYYYTFNITTDEHGNWTNWLYLRFKKDYQEYQKNIENNDTAYLNIKIKKDDISYEISKEVYLLDLDEATSNGTIGGYVVGIAKQNNTPLQNKTAIIENNTGIVTGIYKTEDNKIEDNFISEPGYYKIPSPAGSEYSIKFLEDNDNLLYKITNVTIEQGDYGVDIGCAETYYLMKRNETLNISLSIKNTGDFNDSINLSINHVTEGWDADLEYERIFLKAGESYNNISLNITPSQQQGCINAAITISAISEKDIGKTDDITIQIDLLGPDLTITNMKCLDVDNVENNTFGEGEIIKIKAFVKNQGNENATAVNVTFYYNSKDREHFIGSKHYDSIGGYQKYPSVEWDTTGLTTGNHTIFVIADEINQIEELDESNNEHSIQIKIYKTYTNTSRAIVTTEIYYHAHTGINNEFIAIYNPTTSKIDISGWHITNQPERKRDEQTKIIFPYDTTILSKTCLYMTQNASAFSWEMGKNPDFEYATDSNNQIPQMNTQKTLKLSNTGGVVALKDRYNHTIDIVIYGDSDYNYSGWNGIPIYESGSGVILKRNFINGIPVDTNTSNDWSHPRRYGIGQSDFPYINLPFLGEITTFVSPDCSFKTITDELRKANESIYFNIYEFTNSFLCDELVAALRRNVSVYVFVEGSPIGGIDDREKFILNRIRNEGGEIRLIVNDPENDVYARYTFDHGKYLVIDNTTVIVESCNWAKTGVPIDPTFGNREWGVVVRNRTVADYFLNVFLDDWDPQRCDSYCFDVMDFSISPDFFIDKTVYEGSYVPQFEPKTFTGEFAAIPVFSPDTSERAICDLIESADNSIYIEQLYIYKDWDEKINPFVEELVNKSNQGVDIKIILNYNPNYEETNEKCNQTKQYFEEHGVEVKFVYTNWSYFTNVHNKGMIVDNKSVLISSVNWNENSVTRNREAGVIIENEEVARYYANVFFYDWNLMSPQSQNQEEQPIEYKNTIYIAVIFTMTFAIIARDWRKRKWT